jgi:hypothetical protein
VSERARAARRLSSILTNNSGVYVILRYVRQRDTYAVTWTGGPTAAELYEVAAANAAQVPTLNIDALVWLRTEPASAYRSPLQSGP